MMAGFLEHLGKERLLSQFSIKDLINLKKNLQFRHPQSHSIFGMDMFLPFLKSRLRKEELNLKDMDLKRWTMDFPIRLEVETYAGQKETIVVGSHLGS